MNEGLDLDARDPLLVPGASDGDAGVDMAVPLIESSRFHCGRNVFIANHANR